MAKAKTPADEKFTNVDFNLFEALEAMDRKDYGYYDRLTAEQKNKFPGYMLLLWASYVKGTHQIANLKRVNRIANYNFLDDAVRNDDKLQWLLLCAASIGKGKQYREFLPNLTPKVVKLQNKANLEDVKKYFSKIHPNVDQELIDEISKLYTQQQHRKCYIAEKYPHLKYDEIELLNELLTDEEIQSYERDSGN